MYKVRYTAVMKTRITIATILLLTLISIAVGIHLHKPKPVPVRHHHNQSTPVQITQGVQKPYNDCTPNETGQLERQHQAELLATEQAMAKYNDTLDQSNNANFVQLQQQYNEQVTDYDTCTLVTN